MTLFYVLRSGAQHFTAQQLHVISVAWIYAAAFRPLAVHISVMTLHRNYLFASIVLLPFFLLLGQF